MITSDAKSETETPSVRGYRLPKWGASFPGPGPGLSELRLELQTPPPRGTLSARAAGAAVAATDGLSGSQEAPLEAPKCLARQWRRFLKFLVVDHRCTKLASLDDESS